jgi:hypothetical protein
MRSVGCCHAADTGQKTADDGVFSNWLLKLILNHKLIPFTVPCLFLLQVMFILRILYSFSGFHLIDLCLCRLTSDMNTIVVRVETLCNSM